MEVEFSRVVEGEELWEIISRDFLPPFRSGYLRVGPDKVLLPEYFLDFAEQIRDLEVREDDIWVVSHPKTGTTWTQEMVWCIKNDLDFEGAKTVLPARFPFLELTSLFDMRKVSSDCPELDREPFFSASTQYVIDQPSPRFIKTHLPWSLLPKQIQEGTKKPKMVYVCRNAKDTCISYFHHCVLCEGFTGTFDDFCRLFLGDSVCFAPFWSHVLGFWERRDDPNILFLKFEDMKKDLTGAILKTADFLGKQLSEEDVGRLAKHLSFESMKTNKAVNYEELQDQTKGTFMRSGRVGDGGRAMRPDVADSFDALTDELWGGSGIYPELD